MSSTANVWRDEKDEVARLVERVQEVLAQLRDAYQFELLVDTREPAANKGGRDLATMRSALTAAVTSSTRALPAGDVWIVMWGRCVVVLERKALSDFAGSIKSGRLKEQLLKMTHMDIARGNRFLLVEGCMTKAAASSKNGRGPGIERASLVRTQVNATLDQGIKLIHSESPLDSVCWILHMVLACHSSAEDWKADVLRCSPCSFANPLLDAIARTPANPTTQASACPAPPHGQVPVVLDTRASPQDLESDYLDVRAAARGGLKRKAVLGKGGKANLDSQRTTFLLQLMVVPGISRQKAETVAQHFPCWSSLCKHFSTGPASAAQKHIAALEYVPVGGKPRKGKDQQEEGENQQDEQDDPPRVDVYGMEISSATPVTGDTSKTTNTRKRKRTEEAVDTEDPIAKKPTRKLGKAFAAKLYRLTVPDP